MSDIEIPPSEALVVQQPAQVGKALSIEELHEQLAFIRQVMAREMQEGLDYGKIPGCGDKPGLFQPGAQKLLLTFQLTPHVKREVLRELQHSIYGHREYEFTISVRSKTGREWDGVGTCSTFESKYRYRSGSRKCPECGKETIIKGKKDYGGGWLCFAKKGGCGHKWPDGAAEIENQSVEKVENENPAESWNTVRKMAFKRAIVHAAINATNTSELWSQDLEDLGQAEPETPPRRTVEAPPPSSATPPAKTPPGASQGPSMAPEGAVSAKFRMKALNNLQGAPGQPNRALVTHFLRSKGWINVEQGPEDWPWFCVPKSKGEMDLLATEVLNFEMQMREMPSDPFKSEPEEVEP